jgi:hypothetical protein
MQRPALDPSSDETIAPVYEVRIVHSSDGYAATIQAGDLTREFSDPGLSCAELSDALALTLAILLDSEAPVPPPPDPQPPLRPTPPLVLRRPITNPTIVVISMPIRNWNVNINGGISETIGFLTPFSIAVMGDIWLRYRRASFGTGVFAIPLAIQNDALTGAVSLRLVTGSLYGCGRLAGKPSHVNLSLCGQSFVGAVHGEGLGYAVNRASTRPWFALGSMGLVEGHLSGRLGWSIRMSLTVPIVSQRFIAHRIEGTGTNRHETTATVLEPAKIAAFLGISLRWTIF